MGWKGESARRTLAASLSAHFAQSDGDGHLRTQRPGDIRTDEEFDKIRRNTRVEKKGWRREQDGACERSDSMEPLRSGDGKGTVKKDETESYIGWYICNSRKMRKKKLEEIKQMYSSGRRFATVSMLA